ncbi:hypothetical protein [Streptomyces sp. NPDC000405]|uniref:hypothetical protein n=1 Tax=Streptomyces sp. NPDC000405 TaxID=3161033 RepID=UPI00398CB9E0
MIKLGIAERAQKRPWDGFTTERLNGSRAAPLSDQTGEITVWDGDGASGGTSRRAPAIC